ncbi:MAG: di-trans,poly-cis-decaprenylcistransferase [Legionellales bacterium]|nr:MAG: di-trans,poly-cis-decaprenylcistransferase [Legionellales bacterium]
MNTVPQHIAVIMDGNGRWALSRGLPRAEGHRRGVGALKSLVEYCINYGVQVLTVFAFSSENWRRSIIEVTALMDLLRIVLRDKIGELHNKNIKLQIIGDKNKLNTGLQKSILDAENLTAENTGLYLNVAINYGGRFDITQVMQQLGRKILTGELQPQDITEAIVNKELALGALSSPDLLIRTGGEQRISNFLLWQLAYTELFFSEVLWPDFSQQDFQDALNFYAQRERRFGGDVSIDNKYYA